MPELPDLTVYQEALTARVVSAKLSHIRLGSPFVLRSVVPSIAEVEGSRCLSVSLVGKRIVFTLESQRFMVIHLMVAGRFQWRDLGAAVPARVGLAAFDFVHDEAARSGTLTLTEASKKKRASLHLLNDESELVAFHRGGVHPLKVTFAEFNEALRRESHTLKRALTDPRLFEGIGNSYSDEILHHAKLSPTARTQTLSEENARTLFHSVRYVLELWTKRLREEAHGDFPGKVTAFRPEMAVHGKFKAPCPDCQSPVQRIVYAENESNYCARCQTGGKLLSDRSMARLLKDNWPKTIEQLENAPNLQSKTGRRG